MANDEVGNLIDPFSEVVIALPTWQEGATAEKRSKAKKGIESWKWRSGVSISIPLA